MAQFNPKSKVQMFLEKLRLRKKRKEELEIPLW